ncbi:MAG: Hsp70 family protein, partial [Methylococcales bacterium]|nr:Hsp70 family protein [Methylococcales bacterium]
MKGLFGHAKKEESVEKKTEAVVEKRVTKKKTIEKKSEKKMTKETPKKDVEIKTTPRRKDGEAHFSVGIDLGTTHCVLSYVDLGATNDDHLEQQVMAIPQLTSVGVIEDKKQLPSFMYLAHDAEMSEGDKTLPWSENPDDLVGEIARTMGSKTPIRLVSSAKSWLCHAGIDCKKPILPTDSPDEIKRVSPFQAMVAYLKHIEQAWQFQYPDSPLSEQNITITVPASFDPSARELTVEAARKVGLNQAILLEEPQSALYSWVENSEGDWRNHVNVGDIILVIDVGGGTTDLSLIAVTEQEGNLELTRIAVGDHILLGGDNMDLALAYTIKAKIEKEGKRLQPWQVQALMHSCRDAKEQFFQDDEVESIPLVIASRGSSLMGGSLRSELTRKEVNKVLIEGFLPKVKADARPMVRPQSGLRTTGLPYAQDAGISRHLAAFLAKQRSATDDLAGISQPESASFLHPTAVLLNGGVFKA